MSYSAYCPFIVGTEIVFHAWTGQKKIRLDHLVAFKDEGKVYQRYFSLYRNDSMTIGSSDDMNAAYELRSELVRIKYLCN
jgi:hypothetical protein